MRQGSPKGVLEQILLFLQANKIPHNSEGHLQLGHHRTAGRSCTCSFPNASYLTTSTKA